MPSKEAPIFAKIKNILEIFDGGTPVYVYFEDMGKLTAAPKSLWVTPSDILIHQLKKLLGEENAVLR